MRVEVGGEVRDGVGLGLGLRLGLGLGLRLGGLDGLGLRWGWG